MGEAAPTQATPSGFAPMLGVGMGGSVTPIATSRGSAVPQLHSAIVERLRARIELCRRHHSTCEDRYVRGLAESSDREHESTLHYLNIVHQGPVNRKTKGKHLRSTGQLWFFVLHPYIWFCHHLRLMHLQYLVSLLIDTDECFTVILKPSVKITHFVGI
uniref:Neurogenic mastermind-like N-terminal domain-containing protein n=1 Tax=Sinocyclocheilus rhinocerous TaxID=307959 RepID=A0A673J5M5_9TELE